MARIELCGEEIIPPAEHEARVMSDSKLERARDKCQIAALAIAGASLSESARAGPLYTLSALASGFAVGALAGHFLPAPFFLLFAQVGAVGAALMLLLAGRWHIRRALAILAGGEHYLHGLGRLDAERRRRRGEVAE